MSNVNFDDSSNRRRQRPNRNKEQGAITRFFKSQGLSEGAARKFEYAIIILALLGTLYFILRI